MKAMAEQLFDEADACIAANCADTEAIERRIVARFCTCTRELLTFESVVVDEDGTYEETYI